MHDQRPTLEGFAQVLDSIASDPQIPSNFSGWIRATLRTGGWKIRILQHILDRPPGSSPPSLLDVGAQAGSLAIYAAELGCRVAAVDYGPYAKTYRPLAMARGVDYRECDLGAGRLPFGDREFDFVSYTDVLEHHSFSSKRVLRELHRVLVPGGQLFLLTPNHASLYNRCKLLLGRSVNDDLNYFFDTCADDAVYDGHHREYTRAEVKTILQRTGFRVKECRVVEPDLAPLLYFWRRDREQAQCLPMVRDLLLGALGKLWTASHLNFGRWIWAIGEKERD